MVCCYAVSLWLVPGRSRPKSSVSKDIGGESMLHSRIPLVAALLTVGLLALTACSGASATNSSATSNTTSTTSNTTTARTTSRTSAGPASAQTLPLSGSVTPIGAVSVGDDWMLTVHSAHAYLNGWKAPSGMPGSWSHMGSGAMAVVLDVSAVNSEPPITSVGVTYTGPVCVLYGGLSMPGPMMGSESYGWQMMSPGLYRGPMAYMASSATRQFTLVCTGPATRDQAIWTITF